MKRFPLLGFAAALLLSACGGGGGGGSDNAIIPTLPPTPDPKSAVFNVQAAMKGFYASTHSFNLSGKNSDGDTITASYSVQPGSTETVGDFTASESLVTLIVKKNGNLLSQGSLNNYFLQPDGNLIGVDAAAYAATVTTGGYLPTMGRIGQSGQFYTADLFTDSSRNVKIGSTNATYDISGDVGYPSTTALLCVNFVANQVAFGESDCFHIDTAGNVTAPQIRISYQDQSIILK